MGQSPSQESYQNPQTQPNPMQNYNPNIITEPSLPQYETRHMYNVSPLKTRPKSVQAFKKHVQESNIVIKNYPAKKQTLPQTKYRSISQYPVQILPQQIQNQEKQVYNSFQIQQIQQDLSNRVQKFNSVNQQQQQIQVKQQQFSNRLLEPKEDQRFPESNLQFIHKSQPHQSQTHIKLKTIEIKDPLSSQTINPPVIYYQKYSPVSIKYNSTTLSPNIQQLQQQQQQRTSVSPQIQQRTVRILRSKTQVSEVQPSMQTHIKCSEFVPVYEPFKFDSQVSHNQSKKIETISLLSSIQIDQTQHSHNSPPQKQDSSIPSSNPNIKYIFPQQKLTISNPQNLSQNSTKKIEKVNDSKSIERIIQESQQTRETFNKSTSDLEDLIQQCHNILQDSFQPNNPIQPKILEKNHLKSQQQENGNQLPQMSFGNSPKFEKEFQKTPFSSKRKKEEEKKEEEENITNFKQQNEQKFYQEFQQIQDLRQELQKSLKNNNVPNNRQESAQQLLQLNSAKQQQISISPYNNTNTNTNNTNNSNNNTTTNTNTNTKNNSCPDDQAEYNSDKKNQKSIEILQNNTGDFAQLVSPEKLKNSTQNEENNYTKENQEQEETIQTYKQKSSVVQYHSNSSRTINQNSNQNQQNLTIQQQKDLTNAQNNDNNDNNHPDINNSISSQYNSLENYIISNLTKAPQQNSTEQSCQDQQNQVYTILKNSTKNESPQKKESEEHIKYGSPQMNLESLQNFNDNQLFTITNSNTLSPSTASLFNQKYGTNQQNPFRKSQNRTNTNNKVQKSELDNFQQIEQFLIHSEQKLNEQQQQQQSQTQQSQIEQYQEQQQQPSIEKQELKQEENTQNEDKLKKDIELFKILQKKTKNIQKKQPLDQYQQQSIQEQPESNESSSVQISYIQSVQSHTIQQNPTINKFSNAPSVMNISQIQTEQNLEEIIKNDHPQEKQIQSAKTGENSDQKQIQEGRKIYYSKLSLKGHRKQNSHEKQNVQKFIPNIDPFNIESSHFSTRKYYQENLSPEKKNSQNHLDQQQQYQQEQQYQYQYSSPQKQKNQTENSLKNQIQQNPLSSLNKYESMKQKLEQYCKKGANSSRQTTQRTLNSFHHRTPEKKPELSVQDLESSQHQFSLQKNSHKQASKSSKKSQNQSNNKKSEKPAKNYNMNRLYCELYGNNQKEPENQNFLSKKTQKSGSVKQKSQQLDSKRDTNRSSRQSTEKKTKKFNPNSFSQQLQLQQEKESFSGSSQAQENKNKGRDIYDSVLMQYTSQQLKTIYEMRGSKGNYTK